jgi:pyruvate/2-oxoglutarate dehydrogenase complex dihydrolipoamide acyltransferase (E2) component
VLTRKDGTRLRDTPPMRRMMPHLMPGRNEAAVYFEQQIDVSKTIAFIEDWNERAEGKRVTLFHVVLAAMLRTFVERPDVNRFVSGRRLYQRNEISFSFAIKRAMRDDAGMTTTKIVLSSDDDLSSIGEKLRGDIARGRSGAESSSDAEMRALTTLPRFALRALVALQRRLDYLGVLPHALYKSDPLYTSMFFANLGSVGLDAAYHHLYEYGNCPFFAAIGRVKKAVVPGPGDVPIVRDVVVIKYTFDERITDGLYCANSLELFRRYLEDPALLTSASA